MVERIPLRLPQKRVQLKLPEKRKPGRPLNGKKEAVRQRVQNKFKIEAGNQQLGVREALFVKYYCETLNAPEAVKKAGLGAGGRQQVLNIASMYLLNPVIVKAIQEEFSNRAHKIQISSDDVARYWLSLATADSRELVPVICCRYCYGVEFQYQYTLNEFRQEQRKHLQSQLSIKDQNKRVPFDEKGGDGYDFTKKPNPDCPECRGLGEYDIRGLDLKNLSPGAALLFDGIKKTSNGGFEIQKRDRTTAMQMLQRLLGFEVEKRLVMVKKFDPSQLSDAELIEEVLKSQEYIELDDSEFKQIEDYSE